MNLTIKSTKQERLTVRKVEKPSGRVDELTLTAMTHFLDKLRGVAVGALDIVGKYAPPDPWS